MDDMDDTRGDLEPKVRCEHCASNGRCAACSELRIGGVRVLCGVRVIHRSVLKRDDVMREGVRSAVAIIVYHKMFVNMRCRVYSLYTPRR